MVGFSRGGLVEVETLEWNFIHCIVYFFLCSIVCPHFIFLFCNAPCTIVYAAVEIFYLLALYFWYVTVISFSIILCFSVILHLYKKLQKVAGLFLIFNKTKIKHSIHVTLQLSRVCAGTSPWQTKAVLNSNLAVAIFSFFEFDTRQVSNVCLSSIVNAYRLSYGSFIIHILVECCIHYNLFFSKHLLSFTKSKGGK